MIPKVLILVSTFAAMASFVFTNTVPSPSSISPDLDGSNLEDVDDPSSEMQLEQEGRLFFNQIFNLSAALANRPNQTALTFVPLGSLLFSGISSG